MALRAHSLQSPPACSALSHLTRLSRHESHALSHSTRASVGFLDEYEKAGPGGRGRPTGPPPRSLAGEAGTGRATHTSCLRFFLGLPSLSSFNSPALGRLAPVLRALVPTSAASSPGSTTSGPAPGPSTGDGVGSSEGLAVRALDGPAAMETAGVCATRGCGEPARSERAGSDRGREERGRSSLVRTSEKRAWSTARERGWGGGGGARGLCRQRCAGQGREEPTRDPVDEPSEWCERGRGVRAKFQLCPGPGGTGCNSNCPNLPCCRTLCPVPTPPLP